MPNDLYSAPLQTKVVSFGVKFKDLGPASRILDEGFESGPDHGEGSGGSCKEDDVIGRRMKKRSLCIMYSFLFLYASYCDMSF